MDQRNDEVRNLEGERVDIDNRDDRAAAEKEVADRHSNPDKPHHKLSNPARDPDPTEYPDPYDKRPDPRDPESDDPAPGPSTSEPHPPPNRETAQGRSDD